MDFIKGKTHSKPQSQLGQIIESVTDGTNQCTENWTMFMTICDFINSTEDGPKEALKSFKKRFSTKHQPSIALTLTLLETCVKNCGKKFHVQIATKDFMQDFVKIISPKNSPTVENQNTVLKLLQTWAFAFQNSPELKEVNQTYNSLKLKGIEFPAFDSDQASKAFIPDKSASTVAITEVVQARPSVPAEAGHPVVALPSDRIDKLKKELNVVQQNCRIFGEILTECSNGSPTNGDKDLMEELNGTCRHMQMRVMELIQVVHVDDITEELLVVNDELNNAFVRYDRYKRIQANTGLQNTSPTHASNDYKNPNAIYDEIGPTPQSDTVNNLIDLADSPVAQPQNTFNTNPTNNAGFDPWKSEGPCITDVECREMEEWLKINKAEIDTGPPSDRATSQEFDMFLSQRASAVLTLPPSDK